LGLTGNHGNSTCVLIKLIQFHTHKVRYDDCPAISKRKRVRRWTGFDSRPV